MPKKRGCFRFVLQRKSLAQAVQFQTSRCSATYVRWQRGTARILTAHAAAAAVDRYLLLTGPTTADLQQRVCCCGPMLRQTDGRRIVLEMQLHVLCGQRQQNDWLHENQGPDLQTILRQSYDYLTIMPKVTIDLRRTSNLRNILHWMESFSWVRFTCKIVISSEITFVN